MFCEAGFGWHPQFDNPTFLGWSVVAFYGLAAIACGRAAVLARARRGLGAERGRGVEAAGMWWALASALCFLGVNKQLNLQTLLIVAGRHMAAAGGWYRQRRAAQLAFSVVFGLGLCLLLVWLGGRHRDFFKQNPLAFRGALILGLFVALRAATINHTNEFLRINFQDEKWAWVLEIGGSVLIGIGALIPRPPAENVRSGLSLYPK
jgi:hypothetical protein